MTQPTPPPPPQSPPAAGTIPGAPPEPGTGADGGQAPPPHDATPAAREARYRTERNAAQAALAAATARVEVLQRREVERLAGAKLADAGDLFVVGGAAVADFIGDDGHVDATKVEAATTALLATRPGLGREVRHVDFGQGNRGGRPEPTGPSWSHVLRGESVS